MKTDRCVNMVVDGVSVIVRTSEDKIDDKAMKSIREFVDYVKRNTEEKLIDN